MSDLNEKKHFFCDLGEGISFRYIPEDRFKTGCISVHFMIPLKRSKVTSNAVLAEILKRACEEYPGYTTFRRRLSMLYGAEVAVSVGGLSGCQMITIEISMLDDRFIPDGENISAGCADMLCSMIFRPARNSNGELFCDDDINTSKRLIDERIKSIINNKGEYAKHRCTAIMCENEPYSIEAGGYSEDLPHIGREQLVEAWRYMLTHAAVNILMVGTADYRKVVDKFKEEFGRINRSFKPLICDSAVHDVKSEREVIERMDVKQSKMVIGMRTPVKEPECDTIAMRLMSMLYGGSATSLLFNNVREKLSLCYYCSSSYVRKCGLLFVSSGLEEENFGKAVSEIKKQLAVLADNKFTDEELDSTKLYAVNSLYEINDSVYSIERWYAAQYMDNVIMTPEEIAERFKAVTRSQIAECASKLKVDTIYLLAPEKNVRNEGGKA